MIKKFDTLDLRPELLHTLNDLQFETMTEIQAQALPATLAGRDVLAKAKTGSGKTAVFALTVLEKAQIEILAPSSLILCPTRELAQQVSANIRNFGRLLSNLRVLELCGGLAQNHQVKSLEYGCHIIVGTPGRVLQLLQNKKLDLSSVSSFVLDEADKMLDMGFKEDILQIKSFVSDKAQTMLFSATFTEEISELGASIQKDSLKIEVDTEHDRSVIDQTFYELESHKQKDAALLQIISRLKIERFIVFCKTKRICDTLASFLTQQGIECAAIHGDLQQNERTAALTKFSNKSLVALVATDVAARGIDIEAIPFVINYDLPQETRNYIHRIGRSARAQAKGSAVSFMVKQEQAKYEEICQTLNFSPEKMKMNLGQEKNPFIPQAPMRTLYIGGGKKDKLRPADILGALVHEAKLAPEDVGDILIMNILSYVAVSSKKVEQAVQALSQGKIKKKKFKVGLA